MSSLEALEKISWRYVNDSQFQEWCRIINKDLERLKKLEKDYNLLDTTMESDDRIICELLKENEKLKKVIEILSNYICVRNPLDEEDTYYLSALFSNEEIDKQTHDLLKEVLE